MPLSLISVSPCEVFDSNNRPLCIMPLHSIVEQKLRYKMIAALATDGESYLLSCSERIDATASGALPPGSTPGEYAQELLLAATGYAPQLKFNRKLDSCPCLPGALIHIFNGYYSKAMLASLQSPQLVIVPKDSMAGQKDFLTPLLRAIFDY